MTTSEVRELAYLKQLLGQLHEMVRGPEAFYYPSQHIRNFLAGRIYDLERKERLNAIPRGTR